MSFKLIQFRWVRLHLSATSPTTAQPELYVFGLAGRYRKLQYRILWFPWQDIPVVEPKGGE